jgi:uncharacterized membrane protein (DUF2068 family)
MVALWRMLLGVSPTLWLPGRSADMLLKLIVLKKLLLAALLFLLSVLALGGSRHYQQLPALAQKLSSGDHLVLANLAKRAMGFHQDALVVVALVLGFYAIVLTCAAVASWQRKRWGDQVLLGVFGLEIVVELWQSFTSFAWSHVAAIAISLLGIRLIVVHLRRHPRAH